MTRKHGRTIWVRTQGSSSLVDLAALAALEPKPLSCGTCSDGTKVHQSGQMSLFGTWFRFHSGTVASRRALSATPTHWTQEPQKSCA